MAAVAKTPVVITAAIGSFPRKMRETDFMNAAPAVDVFLYRSSPCAVVVRRGDRTVYTDTCLECRFEGLDCRKSRVREVAGRAPID
jgi:hypothetical protein